MKIWLSLLQDYYGVGGVIILQTIKFYLIIVVLFLFQGCVVSNFTNGKKTEPFQTTIHVKQQVPIEKSEKKGDSFINIKTTQTIKQPATSTYTGSIKGIIKKLEYKKSKKTWLYEVKAVSVSNGKLPYARFYHYKKLANRGDLVYIILNNSRLQNLFFIKKANTIKKETSHKKRIKKPRQTSKQTKHRKVPDISLPTVEHINF